MTASQSRCKTPFDASSRHGRRSVASASPAWHLTTIALNERDDWISVHPTDTGCELQKVAYAGHVEVLRLTPQELATELDEILDWFQGWTDLFAEGPGSGH